MATTFEFGSASYPMPTSLTEITFQQFLDYYNLYGADLSKRRLELQALPEGDERGLHERMLFIDEAYCYVSAFTGIPLTDLQEGIDLNAVLNVYWQSEIVLINEERSIPIEEVYYWSSEAWKIQPPTRSVSSDGATRQEFVDSMTLARYMINYVEKSDWSNVLPLLCAYFRIEDEPYTSDLIEPDGPRWTLLKTLPMDYVMGTLYYLMDTLVLFSQNLDDYTTLQNPPE